MKLQKSSRCLAEEKSYIAVTFGPSHCTPCHASLQGSPPESVQPSRSGEPSAAYRSLIASTALLQKKSEKLPAAAHRKDDGEESRLFTILLACVGIVEWNGEGEGLQPQDADGKP